MGIFKSYIQDGVPLKNRLKYSDSRTIGTEPNVQKSVPQTLNARVPNANAFTKRADDLVRITKLLTQAPGLKYLANETALFAAKDKRSVEERLNPADPAKGFKDKFKQAANNLLENTISGVGQTVKTVGSTLAQVPLNGTGTHFVKGFNGKSKQTYLSGLDTAPHTLVKNGSLVYNEQKYTKESGLGHAIDEKEDEGDETLGGSKINPDKRLRGSQAYTELKESQKVGYTERVKAVKKETRTLQGDISARNSDERVNYNAQGKEQTVDLINALNPYSGTEENIKDIRNKQRDFIKFRFNIITPEDSTYLHFRAYLDTFDDNFSGDWNSFKYNGRAEDFHTYSGFSRNITIGFKIAAQTRYEMRPLYKKIVYLASATAPTYNNNIMRGTLVKATVGDYIWEMPGFISNVAYSWQSNYPWEIALNNPEAVDGSGDQADIDQQELPMVLDCSLTFTPIHKFTPETGLKHFITTPVARSSKTLFFDNGGQDPYEFETSYKNSK